jgi:hypothetical protein
MKNLKTYSIKEILEGDSSSDEDEPMNHFPWYKKGYLTVYDDLIITSEKAGLSGNYPKAKETDAFVKLYG